MNFLEMLALIPLFPAAGALINGLLGRRCSKACISTVACGVVGVSFLLSVGAFFQHYWADLKGSAWWSRSCLPGFLPALEN